MGIRARYVGMVAVWTSCSPVADPGDTLSQLETSGPPEADPGDMRHAVAFNGPPVRPLRIRVAHCHTGCAVIAVAVAGGTLPQSTIQIPYADHCGTIGRRRRGCRSDGPALLVDSTRFDY